MQFHKDLRGSYIKTSITSYITVNVYIFACIKFRGFLKIGNFGGIRIRVLSITDA